MNTIKYISLGVISLLSGCAHFNFSDASKGEEGLVYYEPKPYAFFSTSRDAEGTCKSTVSVVMLPAKKKIISPVSGFGSTDLSVQIENGFVTNLGQKGDTKIPETIASIAGLIPAVAALSNKPAIECKESYSLREITEAGMLGKQIYPVITNPPSGGSNGVVLQ